MVYFAGGSLQYEHTTLSILSIFARKEFVTKIKLFILYWKSLHEIFNEGRFFICPSIHPFVHQFIIFLPVSCQTHYIFNFLIKCIYLHTLIIHLQVGFCPSGLLSQWDCVLVGFCSVGFCPSGLKS